MSLYMEHETRYQTALNFEEILMNRENVLPIKIVEIQLRRRGGLHILERISLFLYSVSVCKVMFANERETLPEGEELQFRKAVAKEL